MRKDRKAAGDMRALASSSPRRNGHVTPSSLSSLRRKMKARAPPPPGKPATPTVPRGESPARGVAPAGQPAAQSSAVDVTVVLPSGRETRSVVNGR